MIDAFWLSFGIVLLAELGDKSQLMALAFAARYPAWTVLVAVTIATLIVHAMSVVLGAAFAMALPTNVINVVAGLAFFAFAAWTLRGDELGETRDVARRPLHALGDADDRDGVLPRGARRQDDARHDHARHQQRPDRRLARLDGRDGRGRRARDRGRRAARRAAPGARDQGLRRRRVRRLRRDPRPRRASASSEVGRDAVACRGAASRCRDRRRPPGRRSAAPQGDQLADEGDERQERRDADEQRPPSGRAGG